MKIQKIFFITIVTSFFLVNAMEHGIKKTSKERATIASLIKEAEQLKRDVDREGFYKIHGGPLAEKYQDLTTKYYQEAKPDFATMSDSQKNKVKPQLEKLDRLIGQLYETFQG